MKGNILKYSIIGILTGFLNGIFGSGGGIILVPALKYIVKMDEKRAHATSISVTLILSIVSSFLYVSHNYVNINILIFVSIGGVLGGFVGAVLLSKISTKYLKLVFGIVLVMAAVRSVM